MHGPRLNEESGLVIKDDSRVKQVGEHINVLDVFPNNIAVSKLFYRKWEVSLSQAPPYRQGPQRLKCKGPRKNQAGLLAVDVQAIEISRDHFHPAHQVISQCEDAFADFFLRHQLQ